MSGKRKRIIAVVVFLVIFVFLSLSVTVSRSIKEASTGVFSPLLSVMRSVGRKLEDIWDAAFHSNSIVRQKLRKERENARLRAQLTLAREKIRELGALHGQLEELAKLPFEVIPAKVIARDPDMWYQTFVIALGSKHGVGRGMPVVHGENLVGRVIEVGVRWSRVRLILDPQSAIPAVTNGGQATGIVVGSGSGPLNMTYIKHTDKLMVGDLVLTSHLGKVLDPDESPLPQGLVIGRVVDISTEEQGLYKSAELKSAIRFKDLREVFVVVPK